MCTSLLLNIFSVRSREKMFLLHREGETCLHDSEPKKCRAVIITFRNSEDRIGIYEEHIKWCREIRAVKLKVHTEAELIRVKDRLERKRKRLQEIEDEKEKEKEDAKTTNRQKNAMLKEVGNLNTKLLRTGMTPKDVRKI